MRSQGKPNQPVSNFGKILKTNCVEKGGVQCLTEYGESDDGTVGLDSDEDEEEDDVFMDDVD